MQKYFGLSLVGNLVKFGFSQVKSGYENQDFIHLLSNTVAGLQGVIIL